MRLLKHTCILAVIALWPISSNADLVSVTGNVSFGTGQLTFNSDIEFTIENGRLVLDGRIVGTYIQFWVKDIRVPGFMSFLPCVRCRMDKKDVDPGCILDVFKLR